MMQNTEIIENTQKTEQENNNIVLCKRIFAFLIDINIYNAFMYICCYIVIRLFPEFQGLGLFTPVIGVIVYTIYTGLMNSRLCKGQTLGKIYLNIKTVNENNEFLSVPVSLFRSLIFSLIFFYIIDSSALSFNEEFSTPVQIYYFVKNFLFFLLILVFLFNTKTRQTMHDYFTKSFVINKKDSIKNLKTTLNFSNLFLPIVSLICFLFILQIQTGIYKMKKEYFGLTANIQTKTQKTVKSCQQTFNDKGSGLLVIIKTDNVHDDKLSKEVAQIFKQNNISKTHNFIQVSLVKQINSGFKHTTIEKLTKTYYTKEIKN